eukprot:m.176005 g.176005  ORF g.176005 m.176005 type:complete len:418 (-) comp14090_c0_seq1:92-1345(-)
MTTRWGAPWRRRDDAKEKPSPEKGESTHQPSALLRREAWSDTAPPSHPSRPPRYRHASASSASRHSGQDPLQAVGQKVHLSTGSTHAKSATTKCEPRVYSAKAPPHSPPTLLTSPSRSPHTSSTSTPSTTTTQSHEASAPDTRLDWIVHWGWDVSRLAIGPAPPDHIELPPILPPSGITSPTRSAPQSRRHSAVSFSPRMASSTAEAGVKLPAVSNHPAATEATVESLQWADQLCARGKLDCEIPCDGPCLQRLHEHFGWTPSSAMIRPSPEIQEAKSAHVVATLVRYCSMPDQILHDVFGCPLEKCDNGRLKAIVSDAMAGRRRLVRHPFPYALPQGTRHYVYWYVAETLDFPREAVSEHIATNLRLLIGSHHEFEFCWYENPHMTIPELYHVQVFFRKIPRVKQHSPKPEDLAHP